jgi:hypothetical protein
VSEDRRRARVAWVAIGIAVGFLGLAIWGLAELASHLARRHPDWASLLHEFMQDFAWLPLMAAAWWVKIRVEDWLKGTGQSRSVAVGLPMSS